MAHKVKLIFVDYYDKHPEDHLIGIPSEGVYVCYELTPTRTIFDWGTEDPDKLEDKVMQMAHKLPGNYVVYSYEVPAEIAEEFAYALKRYMEAGKRLDKVWPKFLETMRDNETEQEIERR
jgi:hypothetical protein